MAFGMSMGMGMGMGIGMGMGMGMMIMIAFCKTGEVSPAFGLIPPGFRASLQLCDDCTICISISVTCCYLCSNPTNQSYYQTHLFKVFRSFREGSVLYSDGSLQILTCGSVSKFCSAGRRNAEPHNRVDVLQPYGDDAEWGTYVVSSWGSADKPPENGETWRVGCIHLVQASVQLLKKTRC
jgi:hypothetical protein